MGTGNREPGTDAQLSLGSLFPVPTIPYSRFPIPDGCGILRPMASLTERAVGRNVARKDGMGKATGKALYADDLAFPGMLYGRTIRSTIPRGRVRAIRRNFDADGFTVVDFRDIPGKNVI